VTYWNFLKPRVLIKPRYIKPHPHFCHKGPYERISGTIFRFGGVRFLGFGLVSVIEDIMLYGQVFKVLGC